MGFGIGVAVGFGSGVGVAAGGGAMTGAAVVAAFVFLGSVGARTALPAVGATGTGVGKGVVGAVPAVVFTGAALVTAS